MKKNKKSKKIQNLARKHALTGGAAAAEALRQINPDVMAVYPITPQTPIIETYIRFVSQKKVDTEIIQAESEHSAISACVGSSVSGARTVTATSSQGLALMNEILYIASGMRLPILMLISSRALSSPLSIHGDHSDVMGARDTGWIQIFSQTVQEVYDNTILGMKLAEEAKLPIMVIMDGFDTSHSVENLETLDDAVVKKFLGEFKSTESLLDTDDPKSFGFLALQDSYFDFKLEQEEAMEKVFFHFEKAAKNIEKITGRSKNYFEKYRTNDAERVLVMAGSVSETAKEVIDELRDQGEKVGALSICLFRPFPEEKIKKALIMSEKIAVLDRSMSIGTWPPLYMEVKNSLCEDEVSISSYVYGLGGRDVFQKDIKKVFEEIKSGKENKKINYIK